MSIYNRVCSSQLFFYNVLIWLLLACLLWSGLQGSAHAGSFQLPVLSQLNREGIHVSARVVDLETGRTLASLNAGQSLIPASVTKLYTAAAVLDRWGAAKRFKTRILRLGKVQNGVLHGNLVFVGNGDPGLVNAQLGTLARRVRESGINSVLGKLIIYPRRFASVPCDTTDRCRALKASQNAYNAPISSAGVDFSNACLRIQPGSRTGALAKLNFEPFNLPMLSLHGHIKTLPKGSHVSIEVSRHTTASGLQVFDVSGGIPLGAPAKKVYRSVANPDQYAGQVFRAFLKQAGVDIHGGIRVIHSAHKKMSGPLVAAVNGKPLEELLRGMLVYSNNYMADTLALDWVTHLNDSMPRLTLAKAGRHLTIYAKQIDSHSRFSWAQHGNPIIQSGSGLTVGNRLSADDITALLAHEYYNYGDFPAFLAGLTVPDQTPVPLLKGGTVAWDTRIAAKTGSLNQPVSVFTLAGYLRLRHGHWGAFAILMNGSPSHPHYALYEAIDAVKRDLERLLRHQLRS